MTDKNQIQAKISDNATDKEGKRFPDSHYRTVTVNYTGIGDNLDDARSKNGDAVVFSRYEAAAVIDVQSLIRREVKKGQTDEQIQATVTAFKLGVKQVVRKSPTEKAVDLLNSLSDEERKALLSQYAKAQKAKAAA